jgi:uncharacterized iron-regulated protein
MISGIFFANAQVPNAYKFYNNKGKELRFSRMINQLKDADVVLFGEYHNNSINHWLQLQVTMALYEAKNEIQMGMEMFEADDQLKIDEYFADLINESNFERQARLWPNYKTDYKPLLNFAKQKNLDFIATNVPRRYASIVAREGFEGLEVLSEEAKSYIAPMPVQFDPEVPNYAEMMKMDMGHSRGMNVENFAKAQAIKDATMAHFIAKNLKPGHTFIHFHGEFHSKMYGAIGWYLKRYKPGIKIVIISAQESDDVKFKNEYKDQGDIILVMPSDITRTY